MRCAGARRRQFGAGPLCRRTERVLVDRFRGQGVKTEHAPRVQARGNDRMATMSPRGRAPRTHGPTRIAGNGDDAQSTNALSARGVPVRALGTRARCVPVMTGNGGHWRSMAVTRNALPPGARRSDPTGALDRRRRSLTVTVTALRTLVVPMPTWDVVPDELIAFLRARTGETIDLPPAPVPPHR
jgi:hypothetical protein